MIGGKSPAGIPKRVFVYTQAAPLSTGSGAAIRVWTNLRAYLDLGCQAAVTLFKPGVAAGTTVPGLPVDINAVQTRPSPARLRNKLAFVARRPLSWELDYSYPYRRMIRNEVLSNEAAHPGSIHHFEYLDLAVAAVPKLPVMTVFSSHDLESERTDLIQVMRRRVGGVADNGWRRALRRRSVRRAERLTVAHADLTLAIAAHECDWMQKEWCATSAHLFPMSCPDETQVIRSRSWCDGGVLRLLHIGSLDAFVGFHSLEFLLGEVFPRLPGDLTHRLELDIVGTMTDAVTSRTIERLASQYDGIRFHGYQEDLDPFYSRSDLQIVAIPRATGLRTRIVESLAKGLPVLSSRDSGAGICGLVDGENIFLAERPEDYVRHVSSILDSPDLLGKVSGGGRQLCETRYSRRIAASTLRQLLGERLDQHAGDLRSAR